jgi:hypothetical protein
MSYPFKTADGGRSESRRPKQKNDCTVRALAIAADLPYDEAYDMLMQSGRKSHRGFNFKGWLKKVGNVVNGYRFTWEAYLATKGQARMNPVRFAKEKASGRYIVRTAKHVNTVIDGVSHDTFRTYDQRCIYGAWRVEKVQGGGLTTAYNCYSLSTLRGKGAKMSDIQEQLTAMTDKRVTVFYIDSLMGLGYRTVEATFKGGEIGEYAQYSNAVRIEFTPKRAKRAREMWQTSHPSVVIAEGWGLPSLDDAFTPEQDAGNGVRVSRSRHSGFSPAWGEEFSRYAETHLKGKILLDLRGYEVKADRWERASRAAK